ncbi:hypothetical protein NEPAR04_0807 [Nematocida parisii]|nr:hypothetical protein NEPAR08_0976 [Nematocida parisii]KAI5129515.1 hypothetical protein NEPAR03_1678 [Nematocida parisii]KAI5141237.1 hypothetical protein NEPAR04_0807 [Nematocida parisii]
MPNNEKTESDEYSEIDQSTMEENATQELINNMQSGKRRLQEDRSFIQDATEKADMYYKKLKEGESVPTFYLNLPCPQCGCQTNGHGQKHRLERKCRVCLLTFQLDTWLMHILRYKTPLKHILDRSLGKIIGSLKVLKEPDTIPKKNLEKKIQEATNELAEKNRELSEIGNSLKKELDAVKAEVEELYVESKQYKTELAQMKSDINRTAQTSSAVKPGASPKAASKKAQAPTHAISPVKKSHASKEQPEK